MASNRSHLTFNPKLGLDLGTKISGYLRGRGTDFFEQYDVLGKGSSDHDPHCCGRYGRFWKD